MRCMQRHHDVYIVREAHKPEMTLVIHYGSNFAFLSPAPRAQHPVVGGHR